MNPETSRIRGISLFLAILIAGFACAGTPAPDSLTLETSDGVFLAATWFGHENPNAPALILLHMNRGNQAQWLPYIESFRSRGFSVLTMDFRGHGSSTATKTDSIRFEALGHPDYAKMSLDVDAAVHWILSRDTSGSPEIGLIGASIGANVALNYMANYHPVDFAVLLSPGEEYRGVKTEAAIVECDQTPILIVAAEDDNYAAVSSRKLSAIASDNVQLRMLDSGGHGVYMLEAHPELVGIMLDFAGQHLKQ